MNPIFTSAAAAAKRRRGGPRTPLWRLLLGEVMWAARNAFRPVAFAVAAAASFVVGLVLGPRTPGPVLGGGWRLGVAVLLGFVAVAVAQALLQRRREESEDDLLYLIRIGVAVALLLAVLAVVTGLLLAVVTSGAAEGAPTADVLTGSLRIDRPLLLAGVFLLAGVLATALTGRFAVPGSLLFLGLGMLLGSEGLGFVALDDPQLVQSISIGALVIIVFDGGLGTSARQLRLGIGPGLALATVGVVITAGVTALGAMYLLGIPSREAWLLGAVVGSTDASAVFSLLRRTPLAERPAAILQVESGLNDPVAILLTVGLLASWNVAPTAASWLTFGAVQLVGGVLIGVGIGELGAILLRRVQLPASGLYPMLGLAIAGMAYGTAAAIGASGLLATYLAGIVLAAEAPRRRQALRTFTDATSSGVEVGLFLLLGLLVFPSQLPGVALTAAAIALLLVLVARPIAVATSLAWFGLTRRELVVVSWLGVRGAVPIVLATLAFSAGIEGADLLFDVVFFVVVISSLLQGTTAGRLVKAAGLDAPRSAAAAVVGVTPLDDPGIDVLDVGVPASSPLVGRRLADVPPPENILIVALLRNDKVIVPKGATRIKAGDRVVAASEATPGAATKLETWLTSTADRA